MVERELVGDATEKGIQSYQSIYENLLEVWCTGWSSMVPQRLLWYQVEGEEEEADNSNDEVVLKHNLLDNFRFCAY